MHRTLAWKRSLPALRNGCPYFAPPHSHGMTPQEFQQLAHLIRRESSTVLDTWRKEVCKLPSAAHLTVPTLNDHIPTLLKELATAFESRTDKSITEALNEGTPHAHGEQRVEDGFDIVEIVAEYNILRGCIHDLASEHGMDLSGTAFHILNRVFDGAIGLAVESYATRTAKGVQQRREEYLAFVAHDLRTPLGAISLATNVLESTMGDRNIDEETARIFSVLHRNVGKLKAMVASVLEENTDLGTEVGMKLERRHFDLWPLVEGLIHDIRPVGGSGNTSLINEVPVDLVVRADANLMRRVFQNLIANAINYTPHGAVRIGALERADEDRVECWVTDTGKGIPAHLLGQVFQKGEGDKERRESAGLGLAIVKTFVEAHGGAVHAESEEGKGTTFRFTLPIHDPGTTGSGTVHGVHGQ